MEVSSELAEPEMNPGADGEVEHYPELNSIQNQNSQVTVPYETSNYPSCLTTGFSQPILRCSMPECCFSCKTHVLYANHVEEIHLCEHCGQYCSYKVEHRCQHAGERLGHVDGGHPIDLRNFAELSRSHLGVIVHYMYRHELNTDDLETAFTLTYNDLASFLTQIISIYGNIRLEIGVSLIMEKDIILDGGESSTHQAMIYFKSSNHDLYHESGIEDLIWICAAEIIDKKETFLEYGSNWRVKSLERLEIKIGQLKLFVNARVRGFLPLPFQKKRFGVINFKNTDNFCFRYAVTAAIFYSDKLAENKSAGKKNRDLSNYMSYRKFMSKLDFTGIPEGFVNPYQDIPQFERNNDVTVNVFTHRNENVVLMRASKHKGRVNVNLFLIHKNVESNDGNKETSRDLYHYAWIKDLNRFLKDDVKTPVYSCPKCFRKFKTKGKQLNHSLCCKYNTTDIDVEDVDKAEEEEWNPSHEFPAEGETLKFKRLEMVHPYPYFATFDFECFSKPLETNGEEDGTARPATVKRFEYIPASYSLVIAHNTGSEVELLATEYFDGESPVKHFFTRAFHWAHTLLSHVRATNNMVVPSEEEIRLHNEATHCKHCKRKFNSSEDATGQGDLAYDLFDAEGNLVESSDSECENQQDESIPTRSSRLEKNEKSRNVRVIKCYNHNHDNGRYVSTICQGCNLKIRYKNELVFLCHSGSSFDFHLLLKYMDSTLFGFDDINIIAKSGQKFVQMTMTARDMYIPKLYENYGGIKANATKSACGNRKVKIKFLDSCQFQPSSLATLVARLRKEESPHFSLLHNAMETFMFPTHTLVKPHDAKAQESGFELLLAKIPFPYSFLASADQLARGVPLPTREHFFNDLTHEACTDDQWETILRVCSTYQISDFKTYTRLYCTLDSLHLAIIWINFVLNGIKTYGLDPTYCCTSSGYSWQCWLYSSEEEVHYLRDREMYKMLRAGIRGGQSFATRKITTANTPRNPLGFQSDKPGSCIMYFDIVGLYSHVMKSYKFPHSDFKWESLENLQNIDWQCKELLSQSNERGYILTVDLEYPECIQDETCSLPLCPEKRCVQPEWLSTRQKEMLALLGNVSSRTYMKVKKLLLHCFPRKNYVIHYRTLAYYLQKGMTLSRIHSGFSFHERPYLRQFVEENIAKRKVAQTESERADLKQWNNSLYGKTLMSGENFFHMKLCQSGAKAQQLLASAECVDFEVVNEKLSIIKMKPKRVVLNNLLSCGFTALEMAKCIFYTGFYDQLRMIFGSRITVIQTDTDSAVCEILGNEHDIWNDLVTHRQLFDFSKIPESHEFFHLHSNIPNLRLANKNESGLWKIENLDISQIISLKSKQYSLLMHNTQSEMKAKGVPASTLNHFCNHNTYKNVVEKNSNIRLNVNMIRSSNHTLNFILQNKLSFHALDVYRSYPDSNDFNLSYPFGHYRMKKQM